MALTIVVNGQPVAVECAQRELLAAVTREARKLASQFAQDAADRWELRRHDGTLIDQGQRVGDLELGEGELLFLNLTAGICA